MKSRRSDKPKFSGPRVGRRIRVPKVRVVDSSGEQLGILETRDALARAEEQGLDLVEVNPRGDPPVCKIIDFGKYKYEESKRSRENKRTKTETKEIKFRPKIGDHDFMVKLKKVQEFIDARHRVKLMVQFRGREMSHPETGHTILQRVCMECSDIITVEQTARMEGRTLVMTLGPKRKK